MFFGSVLTAWRVVSVRPTSACVRYKNTSVPSDLLVTIVAPRNMLLYGFVYSALAKWSLHCALVFLFHTNYSLVPLPSWGGVDKTSSNLIGL